MGSGEPAAGAEPGEVGPDRARLLADLEREQRRASAQGVLHGQAVAGRLGINHSDLETLDLLRGPGRSPPGAWPS